MQSEELGGLQFFDTPKINVVAYDERAWVAASTAKPRSAPEYVDKSPKAPKPFAGVPPGVATERAEGGEDFLHR